MRKKILLLGSGELGKEFVIACQRLGQYVIAVDSYANAPAMQVAHEFEVINMLDGLQLDTLVDKHKPDIIVPEIEAIRTERFFKYEELGIQVVPSAKAANYTMNRQAIRDLAAHELKLRTARYAYAHHLSECEQAVLDIGLPCVIKPLMSSSGKGQSVIHQISDIAKSWDYALNNSRGDLKTVIVEEFIHFHTEITLLTVTQKNGPTLFCPAIGHRQERGDYQESWLPCAITESQYKQACTMADAVTHSLGGAGIWGVEFFLTEHEVIFSELSPRPHDTGMVTLANTLNFNEFELHARAVLGLPIPEIILHQAAASAVILANNNASSYPVYFGLEQAAAVSKTDFRIFSKPTSRPFRRMGVALAYDTIDSDIITLRNKAKQVASLIRIVE